MIQLLILLAFDEAIDYVEARGEDNICAAVFGFAFGRAIGGDG